MRITGEAAKVTRADSNGYPGDSHGSRGDRGDSHGYPPSKGPASREQRVWDPEVHLDPDEARRHFPPHGVPVAGPGLAGYAIERETGKAVFVGGEPQLDVLCEPLIGYSDRSERAAQRAAAIAAANAQENVHADPGQVARDSVVARRQRRRPWQVNVRLGDEELGVFDAASRVCRIPRATLARILLLRGAEAILADRGDSET